MARFTSIGMGRKTFVASTAEEAQKPPATDEPVAGPSKQDKEKKDKKRPRDRDEKLEKGKGGWKRDPEIARELLLFIRSKGHRLTREDKQKTIRSNRQKGGSIVKT